MGTRLAQAACARRASPALSHLVCSCHGERPAGSGNGLRVAEGAGKRSRLKLISECKVSPVGMRGRVASVAERVFCINAAPDRRSAGSWLFPPSSAATVTCHPADSLKIPPPPRPPSPRSQVSPESLIHTRLPPRCPTGDGEIEELARGTEQTDAGEEYDELL
ncbi:hypothetical protein SKAU_G00355950 [Synaphobranchus kaupii]|uniref:Uncharacterized protein n=1 Tax=Synaphobranchus kaupii TaxID=118154 RepID=A0A9Q1EHB3_SYNKA|nr:hypothetical protein SKAU_G00355950 [Synaphobranchus kaupii]